MLYSSSSNITNNSIFRHHDNWEDIFVHQDFITTTSAIHNVPPDLENTNINNIPGQNHKINMPQLINGNNNHTHDPFSSINSIPRKSKKPVLVKDRHTKIVTAQGPRDRRVRLSIQIARKFFDLQDTLGFDKASKTLDWLLTKSNSAIQELVKVKQASSCPTCGATDPEACDEIRNNQKREAITSTNVAKEKKTLVQQKQTSTAFRDSVPRKESRAKARERARERTKAKMHIQKLNELVLKRSDNPEFGNDPIPNYYSCSWNQLNLYNNNAVPYFNMSTEIIKNHSIAESMLIKRKLKLPQQNHIDSKEVILYSPKIVTDHKWGSFDNSFFEAIPSTAADLRRNVKDYESFASTIIS